MWCTSSFVRGNIHVVFGRPKHTLYDLKTGCGSCGLMGTLTWVLFTSEWLRNVDGDGHSESPRNRRQANFKLEISQLFNFCHLVTGMILSESAGKYRSNLKVHWLLMPRDRNVEIWGVYITLHQESVPLKFVFQISSFECTIIFTI